MLQNKVFTDYEYDNILKKIKMDIENSWDYAIQAPYPDEKNLTRGVFAY